MSAGPGESHVDVLPSWVPWNVAAGRVLLGEHVRVGPDGEYLRLLVQVLRAGHS